MEDKFEVEEKKETEAQSCFDRIWYSLNWSTKFDRVILFPDDDDTEDDELDDVMLASRSCNEELDRGNILTVSVDLLWLYVLVWFIEIEFFERFWN